MAFLAPIAGVAGTCVALYLGRLAFFECEAQGSAWMCPKEVTVVVSSTPLLF
jgi:hypothetical protein